jgi:hypothetical protein
MIRKNLLAALFAPKPLGLSADRGLTVGARSGGCTWDAGRIDRNDLPVAPAE